MPAAWKSAGVAVGLALVLMTACAGRTGEAGSGRVYALPLEVDVTHLLSPPPADADSLSRDLAAVRAAQQARTTSLAEHAEVAGRQFSRGVEPNLGAHPGEVEQSPGFHVAALDAVDLHGF